MIGQKQTQSNKLMIMGGVALIVIIGLVAAALIYQNMSAKKELSGNLSDAEKKRLADEEARKSNAPMSAGDIVQKYSNAVVKIDNTLFLHGGIAPKYVDFSVRQINERVREDTVRGIENRWDGIEERLHAIDTTDLQEAKTLLETLA